MAVTIDALELEIESNAGQAVSGIDSLIASLGRIQNVTAPAVAGLSKINSQIKKITKNLTGIPTIKIDTSNIQQSVAPIQKATESVSEMTKTLQEIKGEAGLSDISGGLGEISKSAKDVSSVTGIINDLKESSEKFKELGVSSMQIRLKADSLDDALTKIEQIKSAAEDLSGFEVSLRPTTTKGEVSGVSGTIKSVVDAGSKQTAEEILAVVNQSIERMAEMRTRTQEITGSIQEAANAAGGLASGFESASTKGYELSGVKDVLAGIEESTAQTREQFRDLVPTQNVSSFDKIGSAIEKTKAAASKVGEAFSGMWSSGKSAASKIGSTFSGLASKIGSAFKGITSKVGGVFSSIGKTISSKLTPATHSATSGLAKLGMSLKNMIKYRILRSVMSSISNAIKDGISNLYQYSKALGSEFAASMDSIATSTQYLKNSLGAMAAPIINALAPAIDYLVDKFVSLLNVINQVFALLTGAGSYTKAIKQNKEYADSTNAAAEAAKSFSTGIDELNILDATAGGGGAAAVDYSTMFEETEISSELQNTFENIFGVFRDAWDNTKDYFLSGWQNARDNIVGLIGDIANIWYGVWTSGTGQEFIESIITLLGTVLNIIGDIASAFREAWSNKGYAVIESFYTMLTKIHNLLNSIGQAFREAWNDGTGVSIAEHILSIFTNIQLTIGTLADKLREAWESNGNGVAIWSSVLNIVDKVLETIDKMSAANLEWASELNLEPAMTAFRGLLEAIEPVVDIILDGVAWAYENVLLPFSKWLDELLVPAALDLLAAAFGAIESVLTALEPIAMVIWNDFLQPLGEWTGQIIIEALETVTEWLNKLSDALDAIDFNTFADSAGESLTGLSEVITGLYDTASMIFNDIIEMVLMPFADTFVAKILPTIVEFVFEVVDTFTTLFDEVKKIFDKIWQEGIAPALEKISEIWSELWETITEFWDKWGAPIFENIRTAITETSETLQGIWNNIVKPVWDKFMSVIDELWTDHIQPFVANFLDFIGEIVNGALSIYNEFISPIVQWIIEVLGPAFSTGFEYILNVVDTVVGGIVDFINGLITTIKGIVQFITGVFTGDWEKAWEGVKTVFSGVWDSLVAVVRTPVNLIIDIINGMISGVVSGVNSVIRAINTISFDVPDWVPGIGGETLGFNIPTVTAPQIPKLATGGFPEDGLFFANSTELVGKFTNGRTAVANNEQIVSGISDGVREGNMDMIAAFLDGFDRLVNAIEENSTSVIIGDEEIYNANARRTATRGLRLSSANFADAR